MSEQMQVDNLTIAEIKFDLRTLKTQIELFKKGYVTAADFDKAIIRVESLEKRLEDIEGAAKKGRERWVGLGFGILGAVIIGLVVSFVNYVLKGGVQI